MRSWGKHSPRPSGKSVPWSRSGEGEEGGLAGAHQKTKGPGGGGVGLLIGWGLGGCGNT